MIRSQSDPFALIEYTACDAPDESGFLGKLATRDLEEIGIGKARQDFVSKNRLPGVAMEK